MSSFFTVPASQRKRKRDDRTAAPSTKKRGVDSRNEGQKGQRSQEREDSISGSDLDDDADEIGSGLSGEDSDSDSDEGETAADRRLKLAERYLDNVRDEVDEVGFDAAEIDRDLIAERLKEDVVCGELKTPSLIPKTNYIARTNSKDAPSDRLVRNFLSPPPRTLSFAQIPKQQHLLQSMHLTPIQSRKTKF